MTDRIQLAGLQVAKEISDLVANELTPGTGVSVEHFWASFEEILNDLAPRNRELLQTRENLQAQIDAWHDQRAGVAIDQAEYKAFLQDIGYLVEEGPDFQIEIAKMSRQAGDGDAIVALVPAAEQGGSDPEAGAVLEGTPLAEEV